MKRRAIETGSVTALLFAAAVLAGPARAQTEDAADGFFDHILTVLDGHEVAAYALSLSLLLFTVLAAIALMRVRQRAERAERQWHHEQARLTGEAERLRALLLSEPQAIIVWPETAAAPELLGEASLFGAGDAAHLLAFSTWLAPESAYALDHAAALLRRSGDAFALTLVTQAGHHVEAQGRAMGGRAILRLRPLSGARRELAELTVRAQALTAESEWLRQMAETLPLPVWRRDLAGQLTYVNPAYVTAAQAPDAEAARASAPLFDHAAPPQNLVALPGRDAAHLFDVTLLQAGGQSGGFALDVTEADALRRAMTRMVDAHRRTLDLLGIGIAIFDSAKRLQFFNESYRRMWGLDGAFLRDHPTDIAVLDQLRATRQLPEQQDFRKWRQDLHAAYGASAMREHLWHLPNGGAIRVIAAPDPDGGVAYLFDDVTERLALERRVDALSRVQGETIDNLAEAVAVFASDGRLRLFNPAFAAMWTLDADMLAARPHVDDVVAGCRRFGAAEQAWSTVRAAATGIGNRRRLSTRFERNDGALIDCETVPLPDGATLVTFHDVTDRINAERNLHERNEALVAADRTKARFVRHVSYELRSPLTTIIGFAHFLGEPSTGPLNAKQHEYLEYITTSTNALLAIINNILDLATIDAGAMELSLGPVDPRQAIQAAAAGIQDRLLGQNVTLQIDCAQSVGSFVADEKRVVQVLYNLLANAMSFTPPGEAIRVGVTQEDGDIVFTVSDHGPGIPDELQQRVFDWFESNSLGSAHRGAGLGLSLVRSFVELHGGTVTLQSHVGEGTTVVCRFPAERKTHSLAAE